MSSGGRWAKVGGVLVALCVAGLWTAGAASAHVTVHANGATRGGYTVLTFQVPTESATASTTGLKVQLPLDTPIASVSVQPHAGWSFKVVRAKLPTPITTDGGQVTEAVSEIDWTAQAANTAIKPGEFDQFNVSAGPLPKVASLTFKAIQAYSDGSTVKWIEQRAPGSSAEPAHPAPVLALAPAAAASGSASPSVSASPMSLASDSHAASKGAAMTGIVLGAVGAVLGAVALGLVLVRRRPVGTRD